MLDTTGTRVAVSTLEIRRDSRLDWSLHARQRVELSRERLFPFFADAANLARITPPELGFHITTPLPIRMEVGTLIDYEIHLWRIPLQWQTEITGWNPPTGFSDTQARGPYAAWVHEHRFVELSRHATLVEDSVRFRLPFGRLGTVAGPIVRRQLRRIFTYRRDVIASLTIDSLPTDDDQGSTPGL